MNKAEKQADVLLQSLGNELYRQRIESFKGFEANQEMLGSGEPECLPEHAHAKVIRAKEKRRRRLVAAAAILCICTVALGSLTVTSDAFRSKVFGFLFVEQEDHTDLVKVSGDVGEKQVIRHPGYMPDGYHWAGEEDYGDMYVLTYKNEESGDLISITQMNDENMSMSIDNESSTREECFVGMYEAYYIGGNENHILMWDEEGVFYEITSTFDKKTMIHIAEQLE